MAATDTGFSTWQTIDHRVDGWLLMSSIQPVISLVLVYCAMTYFGPKMMKTRAPFVLKSTMIAYNIIVALLNLYIHIQFVIGAIGLKYSWNCDVKQSEVEEMRIIRATFLIMWCKPLEFLDSAFFILRKKDSQLTFLHIYHHCFTFFFCWLVTRWIPSESTFVTWTMNSGIHVIMYSYYALSALGPSIQKYLWWKRYLTALQIIQFIVGAATGFVTIVRGCSSNPWVHWMFNIYLLSLLYLFLMFYQTTYRKKKCT